MSSVALCTLVATLSATSAEQHVDFFSRQGCPHCRDATAFLEDLSHTSSVTFTKYSVDEDPEALALLERRAQESGASILGVPAFWVSGRLIIGFDGPEGTGQVIRAALAGQTAIGTSTSVCGMTEDTSCSSAVNVPILGPVNPNEWGLPLFTLTLGLLDGFNPCAMWVLLFLLSLLVNVKSRPRMALVAGVFVLASGAVYFAFMAAWLNVFQWIGYSRAFQGVVGLVALVVGAINLKDLFAFKKGVSLTIPDSQKPTIYRRARAVLQAEHLTGALLAVAILAVLVNFIELLCTAGFPAIYTQVLATHHLPAWKSYAYLVLYNAAYMADDTLMVVLAVVTLQRRHLEEKEGRILKGISGIVMLALGLLLLIAPEWLALVG